MYGKCIRVMHPEGYALDNVKEQRAEPLTTVQLGSSVAALPLSAVQIQLKKIRKLLGVATRTQYLERLVILGVARCTWGRQWAALVARIFLALLGKRQSVNVLMVGRWILLSSLQLVDMDACNASVDD